MSFKSLLDVLKRIQQTNPAFSQRMKEANAVAFWDAAVGPQIAKHARAVRVQDGVLWVEVEHPAWRSELHHRKRQILETLNKKAGQGEILNDIFFLDPRKKGAGKTIVRT